MAPLINVWAKETCEVGVYVAAAKEIEKVSGVYFDDKMQIVPFHQKYDADTGRKLWNMSEKLTSISAVYPQNRPQNER